MKQSGPHSASGQIGATGRGANEALGFGTNGVDRSSAIGYEIQSSG